MALIRTGGTPTDLTQSLAPNNLLDFGGDEHALPFTQTNSNWGGVIISCKGYSTLTYTPSSTSYVGVIGIKPTGEIDTIRTLSSASSATAINVEGYDLVIVNYGSTSQINHTYALS